MLPIKDHPTRPALIAPIPLENITMASGISQPISMSPTTTMSLTSSGTSLLTKGKQPAWLSFSFSFNKPSSSIPSSKNKYSRTSVRGGSIVCLGGGSISVQASAPPQTTTDPVVAFGRQSFPPGFAFGAATAAYQVINFLMIYKY